MEVTRGTARQGVRARNVAPAALSLPRVGAGIVATPAAAFTTSKQVWATDNVTAGVPHALALSLARAISYTNWW